MNLIRLELTILAEERYLIKYRFYNHFIELYIAFNFIAKLMFHV